MTYLEQFGLINSTLIVLATFIGRYFLIVGLTYLWLFKSQKTGSKIKRLSGKRISRSDVLREMGWGLVTMFVATAGVFLFMASPKLLAMTQVYDRIDEYGWGWYFGGLILFVLIHDAYFYWTHRLLHEWSWLAPYHKIHHQSMELTPWATNAFHPVEGVIHYLFFVGIIFIFPTHWSITFVLNTIIVLNGAFVHSGHDFLGQTKKRGLLRYLNDSSAHHWHHKKLDGNYSLYMNVWDRWFKTWRGYSEKHN